MFDCLNNGWILDGIPLNKKQCELLNKKGITPTVVFVLQMSDLNIKKRVLASKQISYEYQMDVVHSKL